MSKTNISGYAASNSEPLTATNYNEVDALLLNKTASTRRAAGNGHSRQTVIKNISKKGVAGYLY